MAKKSLTVPFANPTDWESRHKLNFLLLRRKDAQTAAISSSSWTNYVFQAYHGGAGTFEPVSPGSTTEEEMKRRYAASEKSRFQTKFGMDADALLEKTGIAGAIYNYGGDAIKEIVESKEALPSSMEILSERGSMAEIRNRGKFLEGELEQFQKGLLKSASEYQRVYDAVASVDKLLSDEGLKRLQSEKIESVVPAELEGSTPLVVRYDQAALTSALNLQESIATLERTVDVLEKNSERIKKGNRVAGLRGESGASSVKWKRSGINYEKTKGGRSVNLDSLAKSFSGFLTNYVGGSFEVATAFAIAEAADELVSGVKLAGTDSGGRLKLPGGGTWDISTSKTDLRVLADKLGFDINLSNKAQSSTATTKALDTSLNNVLKLLSDREMDYKTMQITMMADGFRKASSTMNTYLSHALLDLAVGGPQGDRIDFMVYQDRMLPLYEYLETVGKVNMAFSGTESRTRARYEEFIKDYENSITKLTGPYRHTGSEFRSTVKIMVK